MGLFLTVTLAVLSQDTDESQRRRLGKIDEALRKKVGDFVAEDVHKRTKKLYPKNYDTTESTEGTKKFKIKLFQYVDFGFKIGLACYDPSTPKLKGMQQILNPRLEYTTNSKEILLSSDTPEKSTSTTWNKKPIKFTDATDRQIFERFFKDNFAVCGGC